MRHHTVIPLYIACYLNCASTGTSATRAIKQKHPRPRGHVSTRHWSKVDRCGLMGVGSHRSSVRHSTRQMDKLEYTFLDKGCIIKQRDLCAISTTTDLNGSMRRNHRQRGTSNKGGQERGDHGILRCG